jgi:hypothetical protein
MNESDRPILVSGRRFAQLVNAVESATEELPVRPPKSDMAVLVGAKHVGAAVGGAAEAHESVEAELSDVEKVSIMMRFGTAKHLLAEADVNPGIFSTVENQTAALIQSALAERAARDEKKLDPVAVDGR